MNYLLLETAAQTSTLPMYYFVAVYVVGFIAAVTIGSIAWYSSKRPAGWEDASKPDFIPKVNVDKKEEQ